MWRFLQSSEWLLEDHEDVERDISSQLSIAVRCAESGKLLQNRTHLHLFPSCAHKTKIETKGGQAPTQVDFKSTKDNSPIPTDEYETLLHNTWAFCVRMREISGII